MPSPYPLPNETGRWLGRVLWLFQQLCDGAFELRQAPVDFDHLIGADGLEGVDVVLVDRPLHATLAAVEEVAVTMRPVDVDRRVTQTPAARAPGRFPLWFLL